MLTEVINTIFKKEYLEKSKIASIGYAFSGAVFLLIHGVTSNLNFLVNALAILILIVNFLRYYYSNEFIQNKALLSSSIKKVQVVTLLNCVFWVIFSMMILKHYNFEFNHITIFLILNLTGFAIGSLATLFWNNFLLLFSAVSLIIPILLLSIHKILVDGERDWINIFLFFLLVVVYIYKQGKSLKIEAAKRIQTSEDLKLSIIENKRTNKALEKETFNKLQASKMSSLVDFAAGIAHEINNPLTVIQLTANKLIEGEYGDLSIDQFEKIDRLRIASERIEKVISSLKSVTNTIAFEDFSDHRIDLILDSILEIYFQKAKLNGVQIILDEVKNVGLLCIAPQVSQILINLLDNAIYAATNSSEKVINIKFADMGTDFGIRIVSSGPLILKSELAKIFLPFYTTKEVGSGPGLGLTISKSLASGNGGSLIYEEFEFKNSFVLILKKAR